MPHQCGENIRISLKGETITMKKQSLPEAIRPLLEKADVAKILNKSVRGLEMMIQDGRFLKPFYLGDRSPRWRPEDVEEWLREKASTAQ